MKLTVQGQGTVNLSKQDFVASGGEAEVYAQGNVAYRVYKDPANMIPLGKMQELGDIHDPHVIKPERLLLDSRGRPVGHTMKFLGKAGEDVWVLCQLFPPPFRNRHGITPDHIQKLVKNLRGIFDSVHRAGVLLVDPNEMNFLVGKKFDDVFAIDAASYQTRRYPATAIMASVKDPQVTHNRFSEGSDWFGFACVSFQLFTGIHPFKGKHPSIRKMEDRMQAGISVFDSAVKLPKAVYPLDVIPSIYLEWYKAVLRDGKRMAPPTDFSGAIIITPIIRTLSGTQNLVFKDLLALGSTLMGTWEHMGSVVSVCADGIYRDKYKVGPAVQNLVGAVFTPKQNKPVVGWLESQRLQLFDTVDKKQIEVPLLADQAMSTDGGIYLKVDNQIVEILLTEIGSRLLATTRVAASCLPNATTLYPGVCFQNMMGATYATTFPSLGLSYHVHLKELDGYRITDAKADKNVLMVVAAKKGKYDRLVFRFSNDYQDYDVRVISDITPMGLNFVSLDSGVCASINEDEDLELFSRKRGATGVKVVKDPVLGADMRLHKHTGRVVFLRGNTVVHMKMR